VGPTRWEGMQNGAGARGTGVRDKTARRRWLRGRTAVVLWGVAGLLTLAVAAAHLRHLPPLFHELSARDIREPVAQWGIWAATVSVLVMVANTFLPLPGESVGIVNGAVFGFWRGFAVSWIGVMSSAVLAFGIGRILPRRTIRHGALRRLVACADALVGRGWHAAMVIRFIPLLPFTIFNVALGRAPVGWGTFLWTTALGVLPMTAVLVAVGCGVTSARSMLWWGTAALTGFVAAGLILRPRMGRAINFPAERPATPALAFARVHAPEPAGEGTYWLSSRDIL
jgi:uncharacterized membrane protein YdjX (TVP38/TMEM64 family)